jgi:hypothetical protein
VNSVYILFARFYPHSSEHYTANGAALSVTDFLPSGPLAEHCTLMVKHFWQGQFAAMVIHSVPEGGPVMALGE